MSSKCLFVRTTGPEHPENSVYDHKRVRKVANIHIGEAETRERLTNNVSLVLEIHFLQIDQSETERFIAE